MFSIPHDDDEAKDGASEEGASDSKPIVLEGVKANHFRSFLRYIYGKYEYSSSQISYRMC